MLHYELCPDTFRYAATHEIERVKLEMFAFTYLHRVSGLLAASDEKEQWVQL